jgi:soluble lytic murein transglycosylase
MARPATCSRFGSASASDSFPPRIETRHRSPSGAPRARARSDLRLRSRALPGLALALFVCTIGTLASAAYAGDASAGANPRANEADRAAYRAALAHLAAGNVERFDALRRELDGYVLRPYLDYRDLERRLRVAGEDEIRAFRAANPDLPVAGLLYRRWLRQLGARSDWVRLARNPPEGAEPELQCQYLRARITTGDTSAYAEVGPLWSVPHSQPRACDVLFERWIATGNLSQPVAWERLTRAVDGKQPALARYLLRFLHGDLADMGRLLYDAHMTPEAAIARARMRPDRPEIRTVLTHGLQRLAAADFERARRVWLDTRATHPLDPAQDAAVAAAILRAEGQTGSLEEPWPAWLAQSAPVELAAALAQTAVNRQQWTAARYWIGQLDARSQAETRWRYWSARALGDSANKVTNSRDDPGADAATDDDQAARYRKLARERDYYGFLAAAQVGLPAQLNAAPRAYDPAAAAALQALPAVRRALELYAVGDHLNARREWHALLPALDPNAQLHAAYVAQESGWIPQSILIANNASLHDHVDLRFPIAYPEVFATVSERTAVARPFLIAIARQESLFDPRARSAADARGVMQLLPGTATEVARRAALAPLRLGDLDEPAINVDLGGRYLARLLARYDHRRALAAAAYNAGPHRVDRWIRDRAGEPVDIWIENIPYGETRNYVKNVLAFTQVYGQLLDSPQPMFAPHEIVVR